MSNLFVVCMGIGTVFTALVILVVLCTLMSKIVIATEKARENKTQNAISTLPDTNEIENRGMLVAAISAAIAEELGTDVSAIRIVSLKRV